MKRLRIGHSIRVYILIPHSLKQRLDLTFHFVSFLYSALHRRSPIPRPWRCSVSTWTGLLPWLPVHVLRHLCMSFPFYCNLFSFCSIYPRMYNASAAFLQPCLLVLYIYCRLSRALYLRVTCPRGPLLSYPRMSSFYVLHFSTLR